MLEQMAAGVVLHLRGGSHDAFQIVTPDGLAGLFNVCKLLNCVVLNAYIQKDGRIEASRRGCDAARTNGPSLSCHDMNATRAFDRRVIMRRRVMSASFYHNTTNA